MVGDDRTGKARVTIERRSLILVSGKVQQLSEALDSTLPTSVFSCALCPTRPPLYSPHRGNTATPCQPAAWLSCRSTDAETCAKPRVVPEAPTGAERGGDGKDGEGRGRGEEGEGERKARPSGSGVQLHPNPDAPPHAIPVQRTHCRSAGPGCGCPVQSLYGELCRRLGCGSVSCLQPGNPDRTKHLSCARPWWAMNSRESWEV